MKIKQENKFEIFYKFIEKGEDLNITISGDTQKCEK